MSDVINPRGIVVGEIYLFEEKGFMIVDALILKNEVNEDGDDGDTIEVTFKVINIIKGTYTLKEGDIFSVIRREGYEHYSYWKFRPIGSMPDYS